MMITGLKYLIFAIVVVVGISLDMGLFSRKNKEMSVKIALIQTIFWVLISFVFSMFIWHETGKGDAVKYFSAYLLEWSLSIDNIFVFIIIFNFFKISKANYSRVLLIGILMAIFFRILFITLGSQLVARFDMIIYIFGAFLLFTGFKMFKTTSSEEVFDPSQSRLFLFMNKHFRTTNEEPNGKFFMLINQKTYLTKLAMVVLMLGITDVVFAVDSIPAVFSIIPDPADKLLIYSSNIFAVLGLRSLFFLLQGADNKFRYLQHGIAIVLLFIGVKMMLHHFMPVPTWAALMVIVVSIGGSILYSVFQMDYQKRKKINI